MVGLKRCGGKISKSISFKLLHSGIRFKNKSLKFQHFGTFFEYHLKKINCLLVCISNWNFIEIYRWIYHDSGRPNRGQRRRPPNNPPPVLRETDIVKAVCDECKRVHSTLAKCGNICPGNKCFHYVRNVYHQLYPFVKYHFLTCKIIGFIS